MREKIIETKLKNEAKKRGGLALKFVSPSFDGVPDRIVLLPGAKIGFVELKAPGKVPSPLQKSRIRLLKRLGFKAYVLDDIEKIGDVLDDIQTT